MIKKISIRLNRVFKTIIPVIIPVMISGILGADTIILHNGTLLVGKVKGESSETILFKNSYGAFTIKRGEIESLYVTKSYYEDIAIRKKLGMDFDEDEIKKNYSAGQKELTEKEKVLAGKADVRAESRITGSVFFECSAMAVSGEVQDVIPYGFGGTAGIETGERYIGKSSRNYFIPWLRVEAGYILFNKGDASLSGFTGGAGPLWLMPLSGDCRSNLRLSIEPGVSSLKISMGNEDAATFTFTLHSAIGYQYSFDYITAFINFRYMYIYDKDVFFNSAGLSAGVSVKFW